VRVTSVPPEAETVFATNQLTRIRVLVETTPDECGALSLDFDAAMPAHGHGMNTRPRATPVGPREFRVDDIKLHMPGRWPLSFRVTSDDTTRKIEVPLDL
jgi:hypothetical protein